MSKRKRSQKPEPDESGDDAGVKDDMVHVTADLLAGSPDIFAGKKTHPVESMTSDPGPQAEEESTAHETEAVPAAEPGVTEPEQEEAISAEPPDTGQTEEPAAEPPAPPAPFVNAVPVTSPPPQRRSASSTAIGVVLVVIGLFALAVVMSGIDLTETGWPLFILIPGITLIVVGFISLGAVATIPGGILTMFGVVLAYANATGDWPIWAYAWSLVLPFGVGLGMYLQALRDRDQAALRAGRTLLFVGLMIFLIGFVLFESILGISGRDYFGPVGKAALPVLLILVGVILLVRGVQGRRKT